MGRDFVINGETLFQVKFGAHIPANVSNIVGSSTNLCELGLADREVRITPTWFYHDVIVDDFGPNVPVEKLWMLAKVNISASLVHYDANILDTCIYESMGGGPLVPGAANVTSGLPPAGLAGILAPTGMPLGGNRPLLSSGNHYMSVNLTSPALQFPWRFRACYLESPQFPLGTEKSLTQINWTAFTYVQPNLIAGTLVSGNGPGPGMNVYAGEIQSSGVPLWDHTPDV